MLFAAVSGIEINTVLTSEKRRLPRFFGVHHAGKRMLDKPVRLRNRLRFGGFSVKPVDQKPQPFVHRHVDARQVDRILKIARNA